MSSFKDLLKTIELELGQQQFLGSPSNLYDPLNYIIGLGGKRIRPVLTLMGCELFDGQLEKAMPAALAIEIFHNFSLIHDDIMDNAPVRRGKATVHEKWDSSTAILSGDLMLVKAYEKLLKSEQKYWPELLSVFNKTAAEVCEGQQFDMNFEKQAHVSEAEYLEMIRLKTSVLLGSSLQLGAIVAGADQVNSKKLYELGVKMGLGFQLMDDYLDAFGTPELVGKKPGGDILAGKKTIMAIKAMEKGGTKFTEILKNITSSDEKKIEQTKEIFSSIGADVYLKGLSERYFNSAGIILRELEVPTSKKENLAKLLVYLQNRSF